MQPKPPPRGPLAGPAYQPPSNPPVPQQPNRQGTGELGLQSSNQYLRTPVVRYSSRMRLNKLHSMKVSLTGVNGEIEALRSQSQSGGFDPPVVVQVSVPGAIVTPPHVIIPVSGGEAQFVIQPIMTGRLTGARVEFLSQGRKVSEVQLPMKVNRGYLAKFFLLLALLLPFLIHFMPELSHVSKIPNKKQIGNNNRTGRAGAWAVSSAIELPSNRSMDELTPLSSQPDNKTGVLEFLGSTVILLQDSPPAKNEKTAPKDDLPAENKPQGSPPGGRGGNPMGNAPASSTLDQVSMNNGVSYTGEDAIWAWTRSKLEREGYRTELIQGETVSSESLRRLLTVEKKYEITKESNADWSTSRLFAIGMHYSETTIRLLYRLFIVFPKSWPFGDLIYSIAFLALAAIFWMYTGPNRRKVKGPTMDIRFAAA